MGDSSIGYWETAGATKTYSHPLRQSWLDGVPREARVLDFGCGYGRVMNELAGQGFTDLTGVDVSESAVRRGLAASAGLDLRVIAPGAALPFPDGSYDMVLLFAILTCVPSDAAQEALVAELIRVLAPGGLLYVSDVSLQDDDRNRARYAAHAATSPLPYGTFVTDDGGVCRHHEPARLRTLLSECDLLREETVLVTTMNGNSSQALQLLARKR
ncbi:class I SAM-dependent methyltransferase [Catellatospora tritici]|uniref:class I SAM-dependent methyltransferase n=1 Tax=Catellatospora tritici TaxID=2851566 RepID=UPI001C2D4B4A|nr:class I SAM-dependent methyltransferase [Catellatospora tritici]MBV1855499.1 class I SAM-dependent methyltransferase [Catellatospora tritici]